MTFVTLRQAIAISIAVDRAFSFTTYESNTEACSAFVELRGCGLSVSMPSRGSSCTANASKHCANRSIIVPY